MKHLFAAPLALIVSTAFAAPALAEDNAATTAVVAAEVEAPAETGESAGPALWKVADEDTTIYLFGTVHALPKDVEWYKGDIADALASSGTIVTEITMDDSMPAKMQELVMTKGMLPQGTTLRSLLDDDQRGAYETAMTKLGMPVGALDQFEPWYAGMLLTMLPLLQQGYSPDSGVEQVLLSKATSAQRDALETIDFQIGLFDELPIESQISFLVETASTIDDIKPTLDAMVKEWLAGDARDLAVLMNEGLTDEVLAEQLLYARNRNWAQWVDQRLDTPGTVFVAVGAGHLAGDKSVQDALEDIGIETQRVQ
ncbi:TraB/GumN family protein [Altererythrobacter sp.]|uniref:TraB/GumN family protein n=1 Tax=Altererythrobacter sp. TaxID=1872480 RepID=UPI003D0BF9B8